MSGGNSSAGPWFVAPPVVGGADVDTVLHATTTAEAQHYASLGYSGFATQAEAEAFAKGVNASQQQVQQLSSGGGLLGTLAGFLGLPAGTRISGHSLLIRGAKILIGGVLLIVGIAHITGAENAVASAARKVPVPA